ncbi:MAG: ATP-binding cassette domain-containing protein [Bacteroidota bacterium]
MTQISFERVYKAYEDQEGTSKEALHDISLSARDNVTTAVVGKSGSGKSTLLQLINGLERPTRGTVYVFGQKIDYGQLPNLRRRLGYAVQGTGLFPHLSVYKNITLLALMEGWNNEQIRGRVEMLMNLVGLPSDYAHRYPHQLSGGEQQRVGLCRAMMLNPRIFLLDEPFGALDPITRSEIHEHFIHLQRSEPRTIILVTHDLQEALKLAQEMVILNDGRIEQTGTCRHILNKPATVYVKSFLKAQLGLKRRKKG